MAVEKTQDKQTTPQIAKPPSPHLLAFQRVQALERVHSRWQQLVFPDLALLCCWFALVAFGLVMLTSASLPEAAARGLTESYYFRRQLSYVVFSLMVAYVVFSVPTSLWRRNSEWLLIGCFFLLVLVYVPIIGVRVNGARRWINLVVFKLQVGELAKLVLIIYAAAYLDRKHDWLVVDLRAMFKLLGISLIYAAIVYKQPDFGTAFVMMSIVIGLLFLAGTPLKPFFCMLLLAVLLIIPILLSESYRFKRVVAFLDPWAYQYDRGYQLVNSLIAVGRAGVKGTGIGESVQKYAFLPEAHTDFIFAIISEELGLLGALLVMGLLAVLVWRAFAIGVLAHRSHRRFAGYVAYGIGLWIAVQSLVNIGVTLGALPTKGLTLPFISYGGSSMLALSMAMAILARIDAQTRFRVRRNECKISKHKA